MLDECFQVGPDEAKRLNMCRSGSSSSSNGSSAHHGNGAALAAARQQRQLLWQRSLNCYGVHSGDTAIKYDLVLEDAVVTCVPGGGDEDDLLVDPMEAPAQKE